MAVRAEKLGRESSWFVKALTRISPRQGHTDRVMSGGEGGMRSSEGPQAQSRLFRHRPTYSVELQKKTTTVQYYKAQVTILKDFAGFCRYNQYNKNQQRYGIEMHVKVP